MEEVELIFSVYQELRGPGETWSRDRNDRDKGTVILIATFVFFFCLTGLLMTSLFYILACLFTIYIFSCKVWSL